MTSRSIETRFNQVTDISGGKRSEFCELEHESIRPVVKWLDDKPCKSNSISSGERLESNAALLLVPVEEGEYGMDEGTRKCGLVS
jgi:hypothetical protein